jgi:sodium/proline symporter
MIDALRAQDPALLQPMGAYGLTLAGVISAAGSVAIGLAFLGSPQLLTRFMAARDQKQIVDGGFWAVLCVIGFDVGAVFGGMAGRTLFPILDDPETILPIMSAELFPAFFTGIFLVVVLAAIMSTVDSLLILASSVVVRDVVQKSLGSNASERTLSFMGKGVTVVIGAVGLVVALLEVRVIFDFVLFAWSGIACAFTPIVLCSLFWKGTTREGAIAGMIGGFAVTVVWVRAFKADFYDLYEMIPGFFAGLIVCVLVSLVTRPNDEAVAELESVRETVGPVF